MANLSDIVRDFGTFKGNLGSTGVQGVQGIQGVTGGIAGPILTNTQSGNYTLTASDLGKIVCGVSTVTIPQNVFSTGAQISIASTTDSGVIIKSGSGVTLNQVSVGIKTELLISGKTYCSLSCTGTNTFVANGNFVANISATGGTITTVAGKTIHTFTASGTFEVITAPPTFNVEYLVVAGGGGGGGRHGGGGGGGGFRSGTGFPVSPGPYSIQVGGGGVGVEGTYAVGNGGGPSVFSTITSTGGGGGGAYQYAAASSGGSGGGQSEDI